MTRVAVFPGSFEVHAGPMLEEPERAGGFWGHFEVRAHALEAGAFVVSGCAVLNEADVAADFPYKGRMNTAYAHGGSEVAGSAAGHTDRIQIFLPIGKFLRHLFFPQAKLSDLSRRVFPRPAGRARPCGS